MPVVAVPPQWGAEGAVVAVPPQWGAEGAVALLYVNGQLDECLPFHDVCPAEAYHIGPGMLGSREGAEYEGFMSEVRAWGGVRDASHVRHSALDAPGTDSSRESIRRAASNR